MKEASREALARALAAIQADRELAGRTEGAEPRRPPNILQALLAVQRALGLVPPEAVPAIAAALEATEAEVAGVLSYYPDLHGRKGGRRTLRVCLGEACLANHADRVLAACRKHLRAGLGETSADGAYDLERVYCVGACGVGPALMVDHDIYGRVTPESMGDLLDACRDRTGPGASS